MRALARFVQATASADFSARVWNAITGEEVLQFTHKHIVRTCCFSDDSKKLLTGGQEKIIRLFDLMQPDSEPYVMEARVRASLVCVGWRRAAPAVFVAPVVT